MPRFDRMMNLWRKPEWEPYEFAALATYNSERARGIVHTPEWSARMAEEQERFNKQQRERYPDATIWVEGVSSQ